MHRISSLALLALLTGCVAPDSNGSGFSSATAPAEDDFQAGELIDEPQDVAADDDDDPEDNTSPLSPEGWDASAPDQGTDGWLVEGTIQCGLLDRAAPKQFLKSGAVWTELAFDFSARMLDGLEACATQSEKYLRWNDDDSVYFMAAGMDHWLEPTDTPNVWGGIVQPAGESSPACDAALAQHGLSWPVHLTWTVTSLLSPEEAPAS